MGPLRGSRATQQHEHAGEDRGRIRQSPSPRSVRVSMVAALGLEFACPPCTPKSRSSTTWDQVARPSTTKPYEFVVTHRRWLSRWPNWTSEFAVSIARDLHMDTSR